MATRIGVSFKDTKEDKELYEFLREKSEIMGHSSYLKILLKQEKESLENEKKAK